MNQFDTIFFENEDVRHQLSELWEKERQLLADLLLLKQQTRSLFKSHVRISSNDGEWCTLSYAPDLSGVFLTSGYLAMPINIHVKLITDIKKSIEKDEVYHFGELTIENKDNLVHLYRSGYKSHPLTIFKSVLLEALSSVSKRE